MAILCFPLRTDSSLGLRGHRPTPAKADSSGGDFRAKGRTCLKKPPPSRHSHYDVAITWVSILDYYIIRSSESKVAIHA
jgi:hypothetical protein